MSSAKAVWPRRDVLGIFQLSWGCLIQGEASPQRYSHTVMAHTQSGLVGSLWGHILMGQLLTWASRNIFLLPPNSCKQLIQRVECSWRVPNSGPSAPLVRKGKKWIHWGAGFSLNKLLLMFPCFVLRWIFLSHMESEGEGPGRVSWLFDLLIYLFNKWHLARGWWQWGWYSCRPVSWPRVFSPEGDTCEHTHIYMEHKC